MLCATPANTVATSATPPTTRCPSRAPGGAGRSRPAASRGELQARVELCEARDASPGARPLRSSSTAESPAARAPATSVTGSSPTCTVLAGVHSEALERGLERPRVGLRGADAAAVTITSKRLGEAEAREHVGQRDVPVRDDCEPDARCDQPIERRPGIVVCQKRDGIRERRQERRRPRRRSRARRRAARRTPAAGRRARTRRARPCSGRGSGASRRASRPRSGRDRRRGRAGGRATAADAAPGARWRRACPSRRA